MKLFNNRKEENPWQSTTDLMSVLMMIFLFIAIAYMRNVRIEKQQIEAVAITYEKKQNDLAHDLQKEFDKNLRVWDAVLDTNTLSIRFRNPEILFKVGSAELNDNFKAILDNFFPRLIAILTTPKYKNDIEEIRIEGHTSSEWTGEISARQAYFYNMELSQNRTRKVLEYILSNIEDEQLFDWTKYYVTANGLSSSKPIRSDKEEEDKERSRRVEFRIKTNAEKQIVEILKRSK